MGFNGRKSFAIIGNTLVSYQVNEKATVDKFFRQRLGGKQMPTRATSDQNHNAPPNSSKHLTHEITL